MDRNTITGLVLIFITMIAWAYFSMPTQQELERRKAKQAQQDSIAAVKADSQARSQQKAQAQNQPADTAAPEDTEITETEDEDAPQAMGMFSRASESDTSSVVVETPLYRTEFTNLGAGPATFTLKKYQTWDHKPLQLIGGDTTRSAYTTGFLTNENYNVETDQLLFEQLTTGNTLSVQEGDSTQLKYALNISDNKRIVYTYTFRGDTYEIDLDIQFEGLKKNIIGSNIEFGWQPQLKLTEKNHQQEGALTSAYVYTGGEREQLLLSESGSKEENYNGTIDWVASRTRFFTQVIKTNTPTEGALLTGEVTDAADQAESEHHYETYLKTRIPPESGTTSFQMFVGPLDYHSLENFEESAYGMVDVGYSWTRWFSDPLVRWIIIPFFDNVGNYMNMGLAIILFGFLVKMILYPFTKKSYKSMAAMKELQPQMKDIQEKYEDDPQKQQKATMNLYKEAKVNPLGGCLPNLLQLPILITLWRFFRNSILIRQETFLWAKDLSAPDYILSLPFDVPFLGEHLAGFVLLMSAAMMVQSRLTGGMSGGGGAGAGAGVGKMMQYFLPIMLLFVFNNFAAGLSLYYLVYNVVSIGQQLLINKQIEQEKEGAEVAEVA